MAKLDAIETIIQLYQGTKGSVNIRREKIAKPVPTAPRHPNIKTAKNLTPAGKKR